MAHAQTDGLMGFAALWEKRPDEENFTIVSTPANKVVSRVIDRMPAILPEHLWSPWLDSNAPPDELRAMLHPCPNDLMEAYPVTRKVNQKGFEGPECIQPIVPAQGDLGLL